MRIKQEDFGEFVARQYGKMPKQITLQVTDGCCLRCTYCYQHNKGEHIMPFSVAKKAIDDILARNANVNEYIDSSDVPGVALEFIGGEPLMAIDLIDQITDYFIGELIRLRHPWATRFKISITSNGVLYFEPKVQEYIKKNLDHLSFSISIDGNKELHDACRVFPDGSGSYDIAMRAVNHFREHFGGEMGSKMTIAPGNVEHVYEAVKSMVNNGYININVNCVYEDGWTTSHATMLYRQLKMLSDYLIENELTDKVYISILSRSPGEPANNNGNWCGGNAQMLAVDWKGNYYPCLRFMEDSISVREPYVIGTVENGIGQDSKTHNRIADLEALTYESQSPQKCIDCPISQGCGWCTAYNYEVFGAPNKRATFICEMHQAEVLASLYYHNRYYKSIGSNRRKKVNIPEEWALNIITKSEFDVIKEASK